MNKHIFTRLFSALILYMCGISYVYANEIHTLSLPVVPSNITQPKQRAAYIISHFWDGLDFRDSVLIRDDRFMEQCMVDFISLFEHADSNAVADGISILYSKASGNLEGLKRLSDLAEQYLYEMDSPSYNEQYYIMFLNEILSRDPENARASFQLDECNKNKIGSMGANFVFNTLQEQTSSLYDVGQSVKYKLLIFFDPDCEHCRQILKWLSSDMRLKKFIDRGLIALITVYTLDDVSAWKQYASTLPSQWLNVYSPDGKVDTDEIYTLRTMPSVYLLSGDNIVIGRYLGAVDIDQLLENAMR